MRKKRKSSIAMLTVACLLCSCGQASAQENADTAAEVAALRTAAVTLMDPTLLFSSRDSEGTYDESTAVAISLEGTTASADSSAGVSINGSVITISDAGAYVLSGTLTNGQIIIDAEKTDKVQLVLKNANIQCNASAAIYVRQADKTFITLAENTVNQVSNVSDFVAVDENSIDSVIYAKDDLTLNGSGALTVQAAYGNGISGKDELTITGGSYSITAAEHGLDANDSICISSGSFTIQAGKDGLHCENKDDAALGYIYIGDGSYRITAAGDGLDAGGMLQIDGGSFDITTGGGSTEAVSELISTKGLKAAGDLYIAAGSFQLDCADDAVHTNEDLWVNNGSFTIATGDDGFHADCSATVADGSIHISTCYEGIEGETIVIAGGEIDIVATDDGINAAEQGEDDKATEMGFGEPPATDGTAPMTEGAMPTRPEGMAEGEMPTRPEGMTVGEMPTRPKGMTEGERPTRGGGFGGFAASDKCDITISGGNISLTVQGDGIDSNGTIQITGGTIFISGMQNGADSPVDSDGVATITGGVLMTAGGGGMFRGFDVASTQATAILNLSESQTGAMQLHRGDTVLYSYTPAQAYTTIVVSCPELVDGESYRITAGTHEESFTMTGTSYTAGTANFGGGRSAGMQNGGRSMGMQNGGTKLTAQ